MAKQKVSVVENGIEKTIEVDVPDQVSGGWGDPKSFRIIGHRVTRIEGNLKVTGSAKYTYDIRRPGMLYGRILRSPYPAAKVVSIDASAAKRLPGVKAVITFDGKTVRYAGEEVVAVAAETDYIAQDALRLIKVQYQERPFVVNEDKAREPDSPVVAGDSNIGKGRDKNDGDVQSGFQQADAIVEATYRTPVQTHSCLETHGAVAEWNGDQLTMWVSSQAIFASKSEIANNLGLKASQVRVICEHMGGGFGSKFSAGIQSVIAAKLAKEAGAPVKLMLPREDEFLCVGNRPSSVQKMKAGVTKDGKIIAFQMDGYGTAGTAGGAGVPQPYIYKVPNVSVTQSDVHINAGPACAMRAPGHPQACFAMESLMDELAEKIGMDALEFRMKNDPNQTRQKEYAIGAKEIGWSEKRNKIAGAGKGPIKRGVGVGSSQWGGGGGPGSQVQTKIFSDGTVEVGVGTQDLGTGIRTLVGEIVAEELGLDISQVHVKIGDTDLLPSGGSGGSTTTASVTPAVKVSVDDARQKLFTTVAPMLQADPKDLEIGVGKINIRGNPLKSVSWRQATAKLGMDVITSVGVWVPGLSNSGVAGTQFAEVEVDTETGQVKVIKVAAVHDCGLVMNRLTAESQIISGVIQGLSFALFEKRILDEQTGRMVNANFETYKIAHSMEIPEIVPIFVDQPERGVIGLAESSVIAITGAVANAVYNACGARIYELPITPDKVLMALKAA